MDYSNILHRKVIEVSKKNLVDCDYDGAIYDSLCLLEKELQEVWNTKSINTNLVEEVFKNGSVRISDNADRNIWAKELFLGAFRLIRNDRWHHKSTTRKFEITCETKENCIQYLGFVSQLFNYLERNLINKPTIESFSVTESYIEIIGDKFSDNSEVLLGSEPMKIISIDKNTIRIQKPDKENGIITIKSGVLESNQFEYHNHKSPKILFREVITTGVKLYSDKNCSIVIEGVWAVKYIVHEIWWNSYVHISPTTLEYNVGDYISNDWGMLGHGECWYTDPIQWWKTKYAWTSSLEIIWEVIWKKGVMKPQRIEIRPWELILSINEVRWVQAILIESDWFITRETNVSKSSIWSIENESIATIVPKTWILRSKSLGNTTISCKYSWLHASVKVQVITPIEWLLVRYHFSELQRYQQIKFDSEDNLFITNQSDRIYEISNDGRFLTKVILPEYDDPKYGISDFKALIDSISIDPVTQEVIFTSLRPNRAYQATKEKLNIIVDAANPTGIIGALKWLDKSSSDWVTYIADMAWRILKVNSKNETFFFQVPYIPISLELLNQDRILIYGNSWLMLHELSNPEKDMRIIFEWAMSSFTVQWEMVYIWTWDGSIYELNINNKRHKRKVAEWLWTIWWMDCDSKWNLYISIFDGKPNEVWIYKLYL